MQEDNNGDMEDDEVYIDTSLEKINKASFSLRIGRWVHCRFHKWWHPIIYFNRIFHCKLSIFGDAQFMETSIYCHVSLLTATRDTRVAHDTPLVTLGG